MIKFLLISIFIFSAGCIKKNNVYYCGDHVCKNKKEAKAYFEQNLVLEVVTKNKKKDEAIDLVALNTIDNSNIKKNKKSLPLYNFLKKKNKSTNDNITVRKNEIIKPKENKSTNSTSKSALYKFLNKEKQKNKVIKKENTQIIVKKNDIQNDFENNVKKSINKKKEKNESILKDRKLFKTLEKDNKVYCDKNKDCDIDTIANEIIKKSKSKDYPNISTIR